MGAGVAVAVRLQRFEGAAVPGGVHVVPPIGGVDGGVAGHPGRIDAVEGIRTEGHGLEQVLGFGDPEQVPGPVLGQFIDHPSDDAPQVLLLQCASKPKPVEPEIIHLKRG